MASNNDCGIREYDMERFELLKHFRFPWPVNVSVSMFEFFMFTSPNLFPSLYGTHPMKIGDAFCLCYSF